MAAERSNRLLICLRYGIGDLVMELPALRKLRSHLPEAHLTALGAAPAVELLEGDADFDAVIPVQCFGFEHWGHRGTAAAREQLREWLLASNFDRVLDASHAAAGVKEAISAASIPALNTGDEVDEGPLGGGGVRSILNSATYAWGLPETASDPMPTLYVPGAARCSVEHFFSLDKGSGRVTVGIAPAASAELKRWPVQQLGKVVRWLTGEQGERLLVFSAPGEEEIACELLTWAVLPGRAEFVPPLHLQQTAALIARCHVFLSNDTGLMHIAAAVGTPTVAVFGPTSPRIYLPTGAVAVSGAIECPHRVTHRFGPSSCLLQKRCLIGVDSCISTVSVEQVIAALERLLCPCCAD